MLTCIKEVDECDKCGTFDQATLKMHMDCIEQAIHEGMDINAHDDNGYTLLHFAITRNQETLLEYLLGQPNIDLNVQDQTHGRAPLLAALNSESPQMSTVCKLIQKGADVSTEDFNGCTALHYAAGMSSPELLCLLLYYGADVSARYCGETPLGCALRHSNFDLADILIDYYDFQVESIHCFIENAHVLYLLKHNHLEVFNVVWARIASNPDIMCLDFNVFVMKYLNYLELPTSQWIEYFYLIFQSKWVFDFIMDYSIDYDEGCKLPCCNFLQQLTKVLHTKKISLNDRIALIYLVLSFGLEACIHTFNRVINLYGFSDELEAFIYAGNYSRVRHLQSSEIYYHRAYLDDFLIPSNAVLLFFVLGFEADLRADILQDSEISIILKFFSVQFWRYHETVRQTIIAQCIHTILQCLRFFTLRSHVKEQILSWCKRMLATHELDEPHVDKMVLIFERSPEDVTLLELSRDEIRKNLSASFRIDYPYQFQDIVKKLPISETFKDVIRFKTPLY